MEKQQPKDVRKPHEVFKKVDDIEVEEVFEKVEKEANEVAVNLIQFF